MAGFYKYRVSRSVSPPKITSYGVCSWIRRSATSSQFHPSMEITMESNEGLSGVSHKTGYVSPLRARTMKEYEQQITELQKENFNLKLRLYFLEEKMNKNFDGDTRQLHEVNIQLKIEAENLRKELEQKEKLLQNSRVNQQKIEEKHEKEFLEWKTVFEREHALEQELSNDVMMFPEKAETEVSISEICKEAFGLECCSPSQTDVHEFEQGDVEAKEKQLEEAMSTLQRLDKLQEEELVDLREMAREKQSSLNSYVAKVKQLQEQQQCVTDNTHSKLAKNLMEEGALPSSSSSQEEQQYVTDSICSKLSKDFMEKGAISDSSSSQYSTSVQSNSKVKSPELTDMDLCTVCGNHTKKLLEKHMVTIKKQSLKRDKAIQGLTEIVYQKDKDIERLKTVLAKKENIELVMSAIVKTIDVAVNNPTRYDKVKVAVQELSDFLVKAQSKLKIDSKRQWPENLIKSLERHFMEWIINLCSNSKNNDERDKEKICKEHELIVEEGSRSMQNLLVTIKQKDTFIQDLHCKLEKVKEINLETDNFVHVQLTENLNSYKKHVEELEKTIENLIGENSKLQTTSTDMKRNYDNIVNQKDIELNNVHSLYKEAKENIMRLQQDLSSKEEKLIKCQKEISEVKEKYQLLQHQNNVLDQKKQLQLLNDRLQNAYAATDKIKNAYKELEIKFQNAIQEKDQQIEITNKGYKELQNEYVRIQNVLSERNDLHSQLRNQLDNLAQKFNVVQQEKIFQNAEIDRMKLQLENCKMLTSENKEKEIQHLKELVHEKTLMAEGLIVELELKDNIIKQLQEEIHATCANKTPNDTRQIKFSKNTTEKDITDLYNMKRYSLPVNFQSREMLGTTTLRSSKLMSQGLSNFGHSDNILELKEEICFLVLRIEKLEQQIHECDEGIGSKLSLLSGVSGTFQDSTLNRTKTWNVLHAHIEELADFLECLLQFDSDGHLDTSLLTPKNLARLKQYLLDSKELSQSLSASLLGNETAVMEGTLDIEPSRDVERSKEWHYTEKIVDEKTENLKNQVAECHAALQDKVVECHNLVQTKEVLEKELLECQDELISCREMLEELKTQLEEKDKDYQKLLKAKQQLEEEEKANHHSHEEVHRKLVGLSELVESMQLRLTEEETKVHTVSTERSYLAQQLENKIRENKQIQDWNLRLQKELEEKETIFQQYQETKIKMKHLEENCAKLKVELTEYSILRKDLTNEVTLLKKEIHRKEKKLKELIQLAQKLEESSIEKNIVHKNEQIENLKHISELEIEKNGLQQQLKEIGQKLLETEKYLQTVLQTQNNMNSKEELLNELKQLQKELAYNVSANKKLRHKLEKLQKQECVQPVKDVGMHCNIDLDNKQDIASSSIEIKSDVAEIIPGTHPLEMARDINSMLLLQNYKAKWKSCENLCDKAVEPVHLVDIDKPHSLCEDNKKEEKTHYNFSSMQVDSEHFHLLSGSIEDSKVQRSHYTSPDLGIESDPAYEFEIDAIRKNSAIAENETSKENFDILNMSSIIHKEPLQRRKTVDMSTLISLNNSQNHARQDLSDQWIDQMLYAVCQLQDYELLKKEIEESLILTKGIQARIKERLATVSSKTSPIKSLEYSTLKELNHSCSNIELYLGKGCHLIGCFWTIPMSKNDIQSSSNEKDLVKENLLLSAELVAVKNQLVMQTKELQEAREKINTARNRKEKMERAISSQLVKTRQVLKEAKGNLTESRKHKNNLKTAIKPDSHTVKENCQLSK